MRRSGVAPELILWWKGKRGRPLAMLVPVPFLNGDESRIRFQGALSSLVRVLALPVLGPDHSFAITGHLGGGDMDGSVVRPDCLEFPGPGHRIVVPAMSNLDGSAGADHSSLRADLCATDSTSTPVRLVIGPMLVHRRCSLSASTTQCVETEPPGHHADSRADTEGMRGSGAVPVISAFGTRNTWKARSEPHSRT